MKVVTVLGARPQFVKAAVVSRAFALTDQIQEVIVHTGQHYDYNMSDVFFAEMQIPKPNYFLGIGGKNHGAMTGEMLAKIEEVLLHEKPDYVLVYGDTNSTLAGALAASKLHIPVAHVEAGLRSFNMKMPEEINRILTDRVSTLLFCPTDVSVQNLKKEGFDSKFIRRVGDVMYDAALFYKGVSKPSSVIKGLLAKYPYFSLATIHRAENTNSPKRLGEIIDGLKNVSEILPIILPLHPRTKKYAEDYGLNFDPIVTIDPVGYFDMLELLVRCESVFTDSGGVQKEAYFFRKACITLRDETEWVELVENGFNELVGANSAKIVSAFHRVNTKKMNFSMSLYGDGNAGGKIVKEILNWGANIDI